MSEKPEVVIYLLMEKETKNTIRYKENVEPGDVAQIGTLYLLKDGALKILGTPDVLVVSIKAA